MKADDDTTLALQTKRDSQGISKRPTFYICRAQGKSVEKPRDLISKCLQIRNQANNPSIHYVPSPSLSDVPLPPHPPWLPTPAASYMVRVRGTHMWTP